jgi:hypothetical protein
MRWSEEIMLLLEEMRRVLAFLDWHAKWWDHRQRLWEGLSPTEDEGMVAYAQQQAELRRALRNHFLSQWRHVDEWISLGTRHPDILGGLVIKVRSPHYGLSAQFNSNCSNHWSRIVSPFLLPGKHPSRNIDPLIFVIRYVLTRFACVWADNIFELRPKIPWQELNIPASEIAYITGKVYLDILK